MSNLHPNCTLGDCKSYQHASCPVNQKEKATLPDLIDFITLRFFGAIIPGDMLDNAIGDFEGRVL